MVISELFVQYLFVSGHGLVVETLLGRVEVKNSVFTNNFGNGIKAKFLDGRFPVVDELLTFCRMASLDNPKFPQLIVGVPGPFRDCTRVHFIIFTAQYSTNGSANLFQLVLNEKY